MKYQGSGIQVAENHLLRQLRQANDADVRPAVIHVVNDGIHVHLPNGKLVAAGLRRLEQLDKRILCKRIALGGNREMGGRGGVPGLAIAGFNPPLLLQQGNSVAQEFPAIRCELHPPVASNKKLDPQLLLQLPDGGGDAGLREKELVGRFVDGTAFRNFYHVGQLLKRHRASPLFRKLRDIIKYFPGNVKLLAPNLLASPKKLMLTPMRII